MRVRGELVHGPFATVIAHIGASGWEVVSISPFSSSTSTTTDNYQVRAAQGRGEVVVTSYLVVVRRDVEGIDPVAGAIPADEVRPTASGLPREVDAALAKGEAKRRGELHAAGITQTADLASAKSVLPPQAPR